MNPQSPVLLLCNRVPYPLKDGGALAMHAMIKGWHDTGRPVYVLAMNTSRHRVAEAALPPLYRQIAGFRMVAVNNEVRPAALLRNFLFSRKPEHANRFYDRDFETALTEMIRKVKPGLIQMESIYLSEYLPAIKAHSKALLIQRLHNIEYDVWCKLARETANPLKSFYLRNLAERIRRYETEIWSKFDLLLPITTADEAYIRDSGCHTAVHTVPFGIDLDQINLPAVPEEWAGYHLGAMDWIPNKEAMQWFVKQLWPLIHRQVPEFEFYMAGRNMPELFFRLQEPGLHCAGEVPDAGAFIADKKILIVPLRSGGGIRIKTLEAMASAKVVISTATGIQGIEAQNGRHYIEANTAQEFADAVQWCMSHRDEAQTIADNARVLLRSVYDQKKIMAQLVAFLGQHF